MRKLTRREFLSGLLKVGVVIPIVPATVWFARDENIETKDIEEDDTVYEVIDQITEPKCWGPQAYYCRKRTWDCHECEDWL